MSDKEKKGFIPDFITDLGRQIGFIPNPDDDFDHYEHAAQSTQHAEENKRQTTQNSLYVKSLDEMLHDAKIRKILFSDNVFVFGRVGYFDKIVQQLIICYRTYKKKEVVVLRTEPQLLAHIKTNPSDPVVLIPAAKSRENLSHMVTLALEMNVPVWLVALPSHLEQQLLLSFKTFFVAAGANTEIQPLFEIIEIQDDYKNALLAQSVKAVMLIGCHIDNLGKLNESNDMECTVAISKL